MASPTVSVIVATFRGARYLEEQLESIRRQTQPADEVLVRDDLSDDGTVEVVQRFITRNDLQQTWRVETNPKNLGVRENFLAGALATRGDIVFFSDQDDVWQPDKIRQMVEGFKTHPDMLVQCCALEPMRQGFWAMRALRWWAARGSQRLQVPSVREQVTGLTCGGLTMAIRRGFLVEVAPVVRRRGLVHDLPFGLLASARRGYYRLQVPLVRYRIHGENVSQPMYRVSDRIRRANFHIRGRVGKLELLEALRDEAGNHLAEADRDWLDVVIARQGERIERIRTGDVLWLLGDLRCGGWGESTAMRLANLLACVGVRLGVGGADHGQH